MYSRGNAVWSRVLAVGLLASLPMMLQGQGKDKDAYDPGNSKWDIFAGYSYLGPHATTSQGVVTQAINYGSIVSVSRYFNKYAGVQIEGQEHIPSQNRYYPHCPNCGSTWSNDDYSGGSAGLIFRFPTEEVTPFVHGLVGFDLFGVVPGTKDDVIGILLTAGGGLDYATPLLHRHLSFRLFQADYQYTHQRWDNGGRANISMAQLSTGFVYHIGSLAPPAPVTLACSASPATVYSGDPVTVTATAGALNPKLTAGYTWSGTGVNGTGTSVTVATAGQAPGTYTVSGTVKEGKGDKPWETANCSATYTVRDYEPPTISCSVTPGTIRPGDTATVTSVGLSPQNRPLSYTYSASAGTVSGSGTTATYSSTGAPTGTVTITCSVADDKGKTASSTTSLSIEAPATQPAPMQAHTQTQCSISFTKDKARPTRVDNEAKACLDQVALTLQSQTDAKAVVVGEQTAAEAKMKHKGASDAALRAVNTKEYLVVDKGIDASRISVATGTADAKTVENYIVPAGADFSADVPGTMPVSETAVKPIPRKAGHAKAAMHHKKKKM